jgi:hypothetical protein
MISMPMSVPRLSINQTIIAEAAVEKEQEPISEQSEQPTDGRSLAESPRPLRQIPRASSRLAHSTSHIHMSHSDNVLCDSMQ